MKQSLKKTLLERLKVYGDFVPKWKIEEKSKELGYLSETGDRKVRELVEEGLAEQKEIKGIAWYRYKKQEKIINSPVYTDNGTVRIVQKVLWQ
jgi:hypothetical protein